MTLLERAIATPNLKKARNKLSEEDLELIAAWLTGQVSHGQVSVVKNKKGSNVYNYLIRGIRELYSLGRIKIN